MKTVTIALIAVLAISSYHFVLPGEDSKQNTNRTQLAKMASISCEGGACEEKKDHRHEHKKKKANPMKTYV